MPNIRFTDTNLKTLSADKTTWFTDPACKGLRLCVTAGGTKTWYVNKWDPQAGKVRAVNLGQWASQGSHCAWAKSQVGKVGDDQNSGVADTARDAADSLPKPLDQAVSKFNCLASQHGRDVSE